MYVHARHAFILVCCSAGLVAAQLPEKVIVKSETHVPHDRPYSDGVLVGNTLYVSGQGSNRPDGTFPETMEGEIRQCMENVRNVLLGAGMDMRNVVFTYVFLEDLGNFELMNTVYREYFPTNPPVRSTLEVGQIPGQSRIEIQSIAVQDGTPKEIIRPAGAPATTPFSSVVRPKPNLPTLSVCSRVSSKYSKAPHTPWLITAIRPFGVAVPNRTWRSSMSASAGWLKTSSNC